MKKVMSTLLVIGLLMTMAVWNVYAEEVNPTEANDAKVAVVSYSAIPGGGFLGSPVHEQAYLTYLVREYSPEMLDSWKEAFAKRNEAVKASEKLLRTGTSFMSEGTVISEGNVVEAKKLPGRALTIKFKNNKEDGAAIVKSEAAIAAKAGELVKKMLGKEIPAELKVKMDLFQKFEKAVADNKGEEIKAILPELLKDYNQTTEQMKNGKMSLPETIKLKEQ